jgi:SAM-dependent methyltransferase
MSDRRHAPAADRNREPILEVLEPLVPAGALVLEIASGTGQHAAFFASRLASCTWQPSDLDATARASIAAWTEGSPNVRPPLALDVTRRPWPIARADVIVCINMIHIAPWAACEALMAGASEVLAPGGVLFMYGPYKRHGVHTAPSNEAFDRRLRGEDASWGVRDLEDVARVAAASGLALERVVEMPANNLSVVYAAAQRPPSP